PGPDPAAGEGPVHPYRQEARTPGEADPARRGAAYRGQPGRGRRPRRTHRTRRPRPAAHAHTRGIMTRRYEPAIDVAGITAIDVHTHIETDRAGRHFALDDDLLAASAKYFKSGDRTPTIDQLAGHYRERRMAAVVFTV